MDTIRYKNTNAKQISNVQVLVFEIYALKHLAGNAFS